MVARLAAAEEEAAVVAGKAQVRHSMLVAGVILLLVFVGYVALVLSQGQGEDEEAKTTEGTIVCLSKTGPGPHTMECAIGLEADAGTYMLKDMSEQEMSVAQTGRSVVVRGDTSPRSEADTRYAVDGAIRVENIREK